MTAIVDRLILLVVMIGEWLLTLLYPFVYSKTGRANPRTRHIRGETYYMLRYAWITQGNIDHWLAGGRDLFPEVLQVQTINRCNAACAMCPYPYTIHLQDRVVMEDRIFTKIVEECASEEDFKVFVPMSKNEPLLDVKLEDRIAEFKRLAKPHQVVELVTNGSALTPTRFERLVRSGLDLLTVSFSANTEATYRRLMHGLSWTQINRNLEAILGSPLLREVNIFLRFILQKGNEAEYPAFRRHWRKRGLNVAGFEINNRSGSLRGYEILENSKSFLFKRMRKVMGQRFYRGVCPHAFSTMHVLENGDVPLCANDWQNRELLGNVGGSSLREIYNSSRLEAIRELMRQGRYDEIPACADCSYRKDWLP